MPNLSIRLTSIRLRTSCAEKYPAKQHVRDAVLKLGQTDGLIYLLGQPEVVIEDSDAARPWRQRRYFYYCSGVDVPNCHLVYDIVEDKLVLYIPPIDEAKVVWSGRGPTIREAEDSYDVDTVRLNGQLIADLEKWRTRAPRSTFYILHDDHRPAEIRFPKVDSQKLKHAIDRCRIIKDPHEIACIRRANEISACAHRAVLQNIRQFDNEAQIQGIFTDVCISQGAKKQAYAIIAGSGENAGTLHYTANSEPLKGRQLVLLDAGSEYQLYASDVTRTFPISGSWPTQESKEIYGLVQLMHEECICRLKPGVRMIELHILAQRLAIYGFLNLGLFHNGSPEEIFEAGTIKGFYPHGLGHHVGLDVHDVHDLPPLRYKLDDTSITSDDQPLLEEGMVITIEPGIYFSRYELNRVYLPSPKHSKYINRAALEHYWAVGGVRIEDDLLITAKGYEFLSTAPKGEEALEIIRKGPDWASLRK